MKLFTHPKFTDVNLLVVDFVPGEKRCLVKGWWVSKCGKYCYAFERLLIKTSKWKEFYQVTK